MYPAQEIIQAVLGEKRDGWGEHPQRAGCRNQAKFATQSDDGQRLRAATLGARNLVPAPDGAVAGGVSGSNGPACPRPGIASLLLLQHWPNPVLSSNSTSPQSSISGCLWPLSAPTSAVCSGLAALIWHKGGKPDPGLRAVVPFPTTLCSLFTHLRCIQQSPRLLLHPLLLHFILITQLPPQQQRAHSSTETSDIFVHTAPTSCFPMQQKPVDGVLIIGFHLFPAK